MKYLYIVLFAGMGATLLVAEPSVYGNNNGGFYASEKAISKNKSTIASLKRKIAQQNEKLDGLRSIVEGLSASVHELQQQGKNNQSTEGSDGALLKELGGMIDKINTEYVSKAELEKALANNGKYVAATNASPKKPENKESESIKGKSTKTLYSEGVRLFVKKRYDEAKKRFSITNTKGHKPAASNYYLGEISYYTKKYEDAIFYFKKSAGLYDKASYIDTLLLHTAISLEKNDEKEQAKAFYENIIANYAGKKTATIAKQKLKKL
jgi:TolA-binding protein